MQKKERLETLKIYLIEKGMDEVHFPYILEKFRAEIDMELKLDDDISSNSYLHNLQQTRRKQLAPYLNKIRGKQNVNSYQEFNRFVSDFLVDINDWLINN